MEEKKIQVPDALQQNVKVSAAIVECYVAKDGTQFFLIKNPKGDVVRLANSADDVAQFFIKLIDLCSYE